eukprot:jgi/Galph1/1138/GphlegSOOS_G5817.1
MSKKRGRVISIQSHVVFGYVGNKAAVYPLELLGFHVDPINTVQFSNHTGYLGGFRGTKLSGSELDELLDGMAANDLLQDVNCLLMGYIGSEDLLSHLLHAVERLKRINPNLYIVCDPVLGDDNRLYVSPNVVPIYRDWFISHANILTPNQFELSILSELPVNTVEEAFQACRKLHETKKIEHIIVTSGEYHQVDAFLVLISSAYGKQRHLQKLKKFAGRFTGAGDLTAALLLGWFVILEGNIVSACEKALSSVSLVLESTLEHGFKSKHCFLPELELIDSKEFITNPPIRVVTEPYEDRI